MFEVGKTYLNTNANSYYLCKVTVDERAWLQNTKSGFEFISDWDNSWKEYTPPKMVKKEGWINVYNGGFIGQIMPHKSEEDAVYYGSGKKDYITTIHIEWEEEEK